MNDAEPLDLDAIDRVARTLHDRADAICADRDGDLNQVDELLAAEASIEALIAEVRRLRELQEDTAAENARLSAWWHAMRRGGLA